MRKDLFWWSLTAYFGFYLLVVAGGLEARDRRSSFGMAPLKAAQRPIRDFKVHTLGALWCATTNYGSYGDPNFDATGRPSCEWPGGSDNNYLYDGGIWIGAILNGEKKVTTYFYNPEAEWEPSEGSEFYMGPGKSIEDSYVEYDDLDPHPASEHTPLGLRIYQRGLTWSMPDYDDFIVYEYTIVNTGEAGDLTGVFFAGWYDCDVSSGDATAPHIDDLVDFEGWDGDDTDTDELDVVENYVVGGTMSWVDANGNGEWDGYDEYGVPYGYNPGGKYNPNYDPSRIAPDGYPDEYTVYIVHTDLIDPATGDTLTAKGDTLLIPRNMSYIYDSDNPTTPEEDTGEREATMPNTGYIGGRFIYIPKMSSVDDPYELSPEELGITFSHQWWNWENDPLGSEEDKYNYMLGVHEFSMGYRYLPNPPDIGGPTFDYRFLNSAGPFDLPAGDTLKIVWGHILGLGLKGLRQNADNLLWAYYAGSKRSNPAYPSAFDSDDHWVLPIPPEIPGLTYSPVKSGVKLAWDNVAEITPDPMLTDRDTDFEGYRIYRAKYATENWEMVAAFDNVDGPVRVVNTEGDSLGYEDLPDIVHSYVDTGGTFLGRPIESPIDGLPYYYVVVAYDPFKPATAERPALQSMESAKANYLKTPGGAPKPVYPARLYETGDKPPDLSRVKVVPNPYRGTSLFEARYEDVIIFTNLPPAAKISIFTPTGDLVRELYHNDGSDIERWDLINRSDMEVESGLYLFVVETEDDKHIGKFVIIKGHTRY